MIKVLTTTIFTVFLTNLMFSQVIKGTVTDEITGKPIELAKVKVKDIAKGANADFDGYYEIRGLEPGTYTLVFMKSLDGYLNIEKEVIVGSEDIDLNVQMTKDKSIIIKQVTVVHKIKPNTDAGLIEDRMGSVVAKGGVSEEQMKNQGANTAIDAAQTVPGVSIEDGKNVYVRGLGDRYTKTLLNGMEIPGLDPNRNSVQLDIFPAAVLQGISIYKGASPNLTGDFTGGLVDIVTKDFPSKRTLYWKGGLGYNTAATFNSDYLTYKGGAIDFLGFDDGTRALPIRKTDIFPNPILADPILETRTRAFGNVMAAQNGMAFLNQNYAFAYGNRVKLDTSKTKATYGYNVVLNYRNTNRFYEDVQFSEWRKVFDDNGDPIDNLDKFRASKGSLGENNVLWSALVSQGLKFRRSKISLALFHTQNGNSQASMLTEGNFEQNPSTLAKQSLQYSQRAVTNANLSGIHYLDTAKVWKLEWKLSPTYSTINDPDIRSTALEVREENGVVEYLYAPAVGSEIRRTWRELTEINMGGRFDITRLIGSKDTLKGNHEVSFGGLNTYKTRDFSVYDYFFELENVSSYSGDPDWYFQSENIWTVEKDSGTYAYGQQELANAFSASQNVTGVYGMHIFPITPRLKAVYGARVEKVTNWYTGQNNTGSISYNNEIVLDEWNVLPSLNLVYQVKKKDSLTDAVKTTNFRGAYFMTLARPSFKEKSIAQIYDPLQGRTFNGNIDLLQTTIHNVDARWEHAFGEAELISASGFYKRFINPIELVAFNSAPNEIQPLNAGTADLYGAEVEIRKSLIFNDSVRKAKNIVLGANFTYVLSRIDMREVEITTGSVTKTEKEIRETNAREGEVIGNYRPMNGQSPFIVNAFVTYKDTLGWTVNVSYNVQGKKLAVIGVGSLPDVYEQPFHSLSLKVSKLFGENQNWKGSLTGRNLLMSVRQKHYESFNAESQIYDYYNLGMSVSASISYKIEGKKKKKKLLVKPVTEESK